MKSLLTLSAVFVMANASFSQCEIDVTIMDVDCNGWDSGSIMVDGTGGTAPYSFIITDASSSTVYTGGPGTVSTLPAGTYTIDMTDDAGCTESLVAEINEPPALGFSEIGWDPCYCSASDPNGALGVVWAAGSGGTPDYNYVWTYLEDGSTTVNTTWGGRPCGTYVITVTDANGCAVMDTVEMTMVMPEADFDITSTDLTWAGWAYEGTAPVSFNCTNTSTGYYNWNDPGSDSGTYFWQLGDWAPWIGPENYFYEPSGVLSYDGTWGIKLVGTTTEGCVDTTIQFITVFGPAGIDGQEQGLSLISNYDDQTITAKKIGVDQAVRFDVYDLSGRKVLTENLEQNSTTIDFNFPSAIYLFEVIDPMTGAKLGSGKFGF